MNLFFFMNNIYPLFWAISGSFIFSQIVVVQGTEEKEPSRKKLFLKETKTPSSFVVPFSWKKNNPQLSDKFSIEVRNLLLSANKFALNGWYKDKKKFDSQKGEYLSFGGRTEAQIRPVSHQVFALAVSLKWRVYDSAMTGVAAQEALSRTSHMIKSLCHYHKANAGKNGWGDAWQSALWASQTALAGWFLWDSLDESTRDDLGRMMAHEADRFLNYNVPYYKDKTGRVITPGDSKAEENAWNSTILVAANVMMPSHPHWKQWNDKAIELQLSSYATPHDNERSEVWNGFPLNQLNGSNMEEDGTVINHNIIHPDYMVAIMGSATNAWIYALGGMKSPLASLFNGDRVYQAMTDLKIKDGRTMYVSENGTATVKMYYPQGNDWGNFRQANYWLMDIMADLFEWDKKCSIKAREWAAVRNNEMKRMQDRSSSGQYYQDMAEDSFPSREEWISYHLAFGYLGLWLHENSLISFTREQITPPAI